MMRPLLSSFSSLVLSLTLLLSSTHRHAVVDAQPTQTISEIILATPELSVLAQAITTAGYINLWGSAGPYTAFGPTDTAFAALTEAAPDLVTALLTDPSYLLHLQNLLAYHIVKGPPGYSSLIPAGTTDVVMANKEVAQLTNTGTSITIGPALGGVATVVLADVNATNGVAHVIDAVLLPSWVSGTVVDVAVSLAPEFSILVELVVAAGLDDDLAAASGVTVSLESLRGFVRISCDYFCANKIPTFFRCYFLRSLRLPTTPLNT